MKIYKIQFFILLILLTPIFSKTIPIGVSPGTLDLGTLERNSKELVTFYMVSPSEDTILVYLDKFRGTPDFFNAKYKDFIKYYSEEDTLGWVTFVSNPLELKKTDDTEILRTGLKTYRDVNLILSIPRDAEPGYHLLSIVPSPKTQGASEGQIGAQMVAITPVRIIFNIPGDAIRSGEILDITTRDDGSRIFIEIHFLNTGTVTISAKANKINIKDTRGNIIRTLNSPLEYVKPGEKVVLTSLLYKDEIKDGDYTIEAEVNYITGQSNATSELKIRTRPMEEVTAKVSKSFKIKWWMILLLIFLLYIIYRVLKG